MWQLKKAASYETAKGSIKDRSHDIPTRKRIIPCASHDMRNRELVFIGKRKDEDDMAKSTKTMKKEYVH